MLHVIKVVEKPCPQSFVVCRDAGREEHQEELDRLRVHEQSITTEEPLIERILCSLHVRLVLDILGSR